MTAARDFDVNRYVAENLGLTEEEAGWLLKCYYNSMHNIRLFTRRLEDQYELGNIKKKVDPHKAWRVVDKALSLS